MSEWKERYLHEIVDIRVSNVDKKIYPYKTLVNLCNYMDAYSNDYITSRLSFMEGSADSNEIARFGLKKDDVIITKDSETPDDIGVSAVIMEEIKNLVCGYHLAILRPDKNEVDGKFLMLKLKSEELKSHFLAAAKGSTRFGLSIGDIENAKIKIPSLPTQKKISSVISTCDVVIEKTQAAIAKYKAIKQGMLQDLFTRGIDVTTGKLRSTFEEAPHLFKESKLGMIPKEWEEHELSHYLHLISYGFTNPMPETKDGPFLITAANVNDGRIQYETSRKTSLEAFNTLLTEKSRPKVNDILLTKDGTLGRVAIVEKENLCINQSVAVLRPNTKLIEPTYLKILLESPLFQKRMLDDSRGSAIKHIYITDVDKMIVSIPSPDEQKLIAERITLVNRKLQTEQSYLVKMHQLKRGLMEDLLTGRRKMKVAEELATQNENY